MQVSDVVTGDGAGDGRRCGYGQSTCAEGAGERKNEKESWRGTG